MPKPDNPDYQMCDRCYRKVDPKELKKHKDFKGLICDSCRVALKLGEIYEN